MSSRILLGILFLLMLGAAAWFVLCRDPLTATNDQVSADVVINTVKCELAEIVNDEIYKKQSRIKLDAPEQAKPKLTLNLKIVDTRTTGGGIGVGGSTGNILVFDAKLDGNASSTSAKAHTVDTQLVFLFPQSIGSAPTDICKTARRMGNGLGLKTAVLSLIQQINMAETGEPYIEASSMKYSAAFGLTREAKFGAEFAFVPLKLSANRQSRLEDVQTITFEIPIEGKKFVIQPK